MYFIGVYIVRLRQCWRDDTKGEVCLLPYCKEQVEITRKSLHNTALDDKRRGSLRTRPNAIKSV